MDEHLQRALIELYYAMAEFDRGAGDPPNDESRDDMRERMLIVRDTLEDLLRSDARRTPAVLA